MDYFFLVVIGVTAACWIIGHIVGGWYGMAGDMALGIVGAILGGYLLMAAIGGIVLISIVRIFKRARTTTLSV